MTEMAARTKTSISHFIIMMSLFFATPVQTFPDSASPVMVSVPISAPPSSDSEPPCVVHALVANCSSWDLVPSQRFQLPEACPGPWSKIVLEFNANEQGTQYDRFGAVWIGDVEVARTTTPEPTAAGIIWSFQSDLTIYAQYFTSTPNLTTSLSIPNNVDSTYTGVINVDISIAFYPEISDSSRSRSRSSSSSASATIITDVLPLTKAPSAEGGNPWSVMTVVGNQSLSYEVSLSPMKAYSSVYLDLYASPHGCEEFYYSNLPSNYAAEMGICGNGVYRELQVYVDGKLAGAAYPFPVIYSGGINPFLWRPMAGIMSFSIPPHRFDISPFAHLLQSDGSHQVSVTVYGNNEADGGYWFLDAALLASYNTSSSAPVIVSSSLSLVDSGVQEQVTMDLNCTLGGLAFDTAGFHEYSTTRTDVMSDGSTVYTEVIGKLAMANSNAYVNETTMITSQQTTTTIAVHLKEVDTAGHVRSSYTTATADDFPLWVNSYYNEDATTMDLAATVSYAYHRSKLWRPTATSQAIILQWKDPMKSTAAYNRSLDHTVVYVESDTSAQHFLVTDTSSSNSGAVSVLEGGNCQLPQGLWLCGYEVCGQLLAESGPQGQLKSDPPPAASTIVSGSGKLLPLSSMDESNRPLTLSDVRAMFTHINAAAVAKAVRTNNQQASGNSGSHKVDSAVEELLRLRVNSGDTGTLAARAANGSSLAYSKPLFRTAQLARANVGLASRRSP